MNRTELQVILEGIKTALPVSVDLVSKDSKMRVKNNPNRDALKHVTISGLMGSDYSNSVNNQLSRESNDMDFSSQKPLWMEHHGRNLGVNKAGTKFYLPMKVQSCTTPIYMNGDQDVTVDVQPFLRKDVAPHTQKKLVKKIIWRAPALLSIVSIRIFGAEYSITG
jgi:hypothetical protein